MSVRAAVRLQIPCALRIANALFAFAGHRNFVFSPISINVALSAIAATAKGQTLDQLLAFLGLRGRSTHTLADRNALYSHIVSRILADASVTGGPRLLSAKGVFFNEGAVVLRDSFKEIFAETYRGEVRAIDFREKAAEATSEINSWAENASNGLIRHLLPSGYVDNYTRLVLADFICFKGIWDQKFKASDTEYSDFHLLDGTSLKVPFITSSEDQFFCSYEGFKVLRLPYHQGDDIRLFSMYIFLPDAKDGISCLFKILTSGPEKLNQYIPMKKVPIERLILPKFRISFGFDASKLLKGLGLVLPLGTYNDISKMLHPTVANNVCVTSFFHKSLIEVDEERMGGSPTFGVLYPGSSSVGKFVNFIADHPFVFLIREDITGSMMFMGCVFNPLLDD